MKRESQDEDYEFTIEWDDGWEVSLPHQCSSWQILGWDWDKQPTDSGQAIRQMRLFARRATEALAELERQVAARSGEETVTSTTDAEASERGE